MFKPNLLSTISLEIYGSDLLGAGVGAWMNIARAVMYIMATVEAVAWSYAGSYVVTDPEAKILVSISIGAIIFSLLLAIDISILTAQIHDPLQDTPIATDERSNLNSRAGKTAKFVVSVFVRIAIAGASIWAVSPLLNMAVFSKDITQQIEKAQTAQLDKKQTELESAVSTMQARSTTLDGLKSDLQKKNAQLVEFRNRYVIEIDGQGGSKKVGLGPIAESINAQIIQTKADIDQITKAIDIETKAVEANLKKPNDALSQFLVARVKADNRALSQQFGITANPDSLNSRLQVFESEIRNTTAGVTVRYTIITFQSLLIVAFLLLKLFEPTDVAYYFSQEIQDLHSLFDSGALDDFSAGTLKRGSIAYPISPSLFWKNVSPLLQEYVENQKSTKQIRDAGKVTAKLDRDEEAKSKVLDQKLRNAKARLEQAEGELTYYQNQETELTRDINSLVSKLDGKKNEKTRDELQLASLDHKIKNITPEILRKFPTIYVERDKYREKIGELQTECADLDRALVLARSRLGGIQSAFSLRKTMYDSVRETMKDFSYE